MSRMKDKRQAEAVARDRAKRVDAVAKTASEAASKAVAEAMAAMAEERARDREIIRANQETIPELIRRLPESLDGT